MKIYMVRHGQSTANLRDEISTPDTPLTDRGVEDAIRAGKMLAGKSFDRVLVSPYLRAMQTQQNAMPGVEATVLDCLHECFCGDIEGKSYASLFEKYGDEFREMIRVDDFTAFNGENYAGMRVRAREFLRYVEGLGVDNVVAFSHAGMVLTTFDEIMNRPGKPDRNIECDNGSVSVFEFRNGKWRVSAFNMTYDLWAGGRSE